MTREIAKVFCNPASILKIGLWQGVLGTNVRTRLSLVLLVWSFSFSTCSLLETGGNISPWLLIHQSLCDEEADHISSGPSGSLTQQQLGSITVTSFPGIAWELCFTNSFFNGGDILPSPEQIEHIYRWQISRGDWVFDIPSFLFFFSLGRTQFLPQASKKVPDLSL
jgi:hypothetical protein